MTTPAYSRTTRAFHWLTAVLLLAIIPLGPVANDAPFGTDAEIARKILLFSLHKTLGIAIFIVALARIAYASTQTNPAPLHPDRIAETLLANIVHWLLYLSLVLVPLSGWISHAAAAVAAPIWLPFTGALPFVPTDPALSDLFGGLHWLWGKIMIGAIVLHIAGAFKHHFVDKDYTLKRMAIGPSKTDIPAPSTTFSASAPIIATLVFALVAAAVAAAGMLTTDRTAQNTSPLQAAPSAWTVTEGTIGIAITQLGNRIAGYFTNWSATIIYDEAAAGTVGRVETTIDIGSLALGAVSAQAMGPDFFDQRRFPVARFAADIIRDANGLRADGTLTIKGITADVSLPFYLVVAGNVAQMSGTLTLDRRAFRVGETMADESNLGFGVDVTLNITARK
uniref:cytochrome b/b6 domain-containing protein n=1 Tax=Yoonia sp. TaxID=2212373 RepID=UPI0040486FE4